MSAPLQVLADGNARHFLAQLGFIDPTSSVVRRRMSFVCMLTFH